MSHLASIHTALRWKPVTSRIDGGLHGTGSDESAALTTGAANALLDSEEGEYEFAPGPRHVFDTRTPAQVAAGQMGAPYTAPPNVRYRLQRGSRLVARGTRLVLPHVSAGAYDCLGVEESGQIDIGRVAALSLPWFGTKTTGDGVTDDSDTFARWSDALAKDWRTYGSMFDTVGRAWIPPASSGRYRLTRTVTLNRPCGVIVEGNGHYQSLMQWQGPADIPVLKVVNPLRCLFQDFGIINQSGGRPSAMIEVQGHRLADVPNLFGASRPIFDRLWLGGTTGPYRMRIGILFCYADTDEEMAAAGIHPTPEDPFAYYNFYNFQNDQGCFTNCHIVGASEASVQLGTLERNGSNMMSFSFDNCSFLDGESAVRVYQGSFTWLAGYVANHTVADFHVLAQQSNAPLSIIGCNSEGCRQFFRHVTSDLPGGSVQGMFHPWSTTIQGCRVETDLIAGIDGYLIETEGSGPYIITGNHFGHPTDGKAPRFRHKVPYSPTGTDLDPAPYWTDLSVRYDSNVFHSFDPITGYGTVDYDPVEIETPAGVVPAPYTLRRSGNLYRKMIPAPNGNWAVRMKPAEEA